MLRLPFRRLGVAAVVALVASLLIPAAARAAEPDTGEVYALTYSAQGLTGIDIYTAAPGVTSMQLYRQLQRRGVPGLLDPSTRAGRMSPLEVGDCGIEGAYALGKRCGSARYHWIRRGSDPRPKVYFQ